MPEQSARKRLRSHRSAKEKAKNKAIQETQRHYLDILPIELLALVLSYVNSPKDVLAVTRCNKALCTKLLSKSQNFIWKHARQVCSVEPMSPPPPGWSEAAYAAFIFDGGFCEMCRVHTDKSYMSFALRARLCGGNKCRMDFINQKLVIDPISPEVRPYLEKWIPRLEESTLLDEGLHGGRLICRKTDWDAGVEEYNRTLVTTGSLKAMAKRHEKEERLMFAMTAHYRELCRFSKSWDSQHSKTKSHNGTTLTTIATQEGWEVGHMLATPTFRDFHYGLTNGLQTYRVKDFYRIRAQVTAEIDAYASKLERRKQGRGFTQRRADIERHHQRLKSSGAYGVIPSLSEFRKLPAMQAMLEAEADSIDEELKRSDSTAVLLRGSLKKWTDDARAGLARLLGYKDYKNASSRTLHPAERVTARFLCKACDKKAVSLDFAGVCKHECPKMSRGSLKAPWSATRFIVDQKAIDAHAQAANLTEMIDVEQTTALGNLEILGCYWQCKSCDPPVSMNFRCLAAHSKRHENMKLDLHANRPCPTLYPFHPGIVSRYTDKDPSSKVLRVVERFMCRHCPIPKTGMPKMVKITVPLVTACEVLGLPEPKVKASTTSSPATPSMHAPNRSTANVGTGDNVELALKDELEAPAFSIDKKLIPKESFSFDGLVSHIKSKHGVVSVGDEDLFPITHHQLV